MKKYQAGKDETGSLIVIVDDGDESYMLPTRFDLRNHSPTGFASGYCGSGPAQLSLALLADALGDDQKAIRNYQTFKFKVVSRLPHDAWELTQQQITDTVAQLEADQGRSR